MKNRNLILSGLGLYFITSNLYYYNSQTIENSIDNSKNNLKTSDNLERLNNSKFDEWFTSFDDLKENDNFIINQMILSKNTFELQVIPSPFGNTNGVKIVNKNNELFLNVDNSVLVLLNKDNLDNNKNIVKLSYEYNILGGKKILILTSGSNYSIDNIEDFPKEPFKDCKVDLIDLGNNNRKVVIESKKSLNIVGVFGQELYIKNLKYLFEKSD